MATISIDGNDLTIHVQGMDRLWTFKRRLTIPLTHVQGARADPAIASGYKGWRAPGAHIPGVLVAGTFHRDGKRVFWDVHNKDKAVVIELEDDSYQRLVVEVDDPSATVQLIERAVGER